MTGRLALSRRMCILLALASLGISLVTITGPTFGLLMAHAPISIEGNGNFTASNGVTAGSGTPSDPYVIEGWLIDATSNHGIRIRNTDAHVVMRNLTIEEPDAYPTWWSIALSFASNVRVENVTARGGEVGIHIWYSSGIEVVDSSLTAQIGVELYSSSYVSMQRNHIAKEKGIVFWGANGALLEENDVSYTGTAIFLGESSNVTLARNTLAWNSNHGIHTDKSANLTIEWNDISHNGLNGLVLESTNNSIVRGNRIAYNGHRVPGRGQGVVLVDSFGFLVYHNDLVSNEMQARDTVPGENEWDAGYQNGGNYWSDYIGTDQCSGPGQDVCDGPDGFGDSPRVIGEAAQDRYPLMSPVYDSNPPTIIHVPPVGVFVNESFRLEVTVEDESEVVYVSFWFAIDSQDWSATSMTPTSENSFFVDVPPQYVPGPFHYYFLAWDRWENQGRSPTVGDHVLQVVERPPPPWEDALVIGILATAAGAPVVLFFLLRRPRRPRSQSREGESPEAEGRTTTSHAERPP